MYCPFVQFAGELFLGCLGLFGSLLSPSGPLKCEMPVVIGHSHCVCELACCMASVLFPATVVCCPGGVFRRCSPGAKGDRASPLGRLTWKVGWTIGTTCCQSHVVVVFDVVWQHGTCNSLNVFGFKCCLLIVSYCGSKREDVCLSQQVSGSHV